MTAKFFLVTLQADLGISENTRQRTFVVSEAPVQFWLRNLTSCSVQNVVVLHSEEIDQATYERARPMVNPPNKSYYWRLSDADATPGDPDEDEDSEEDDLGGS